MFSSYLMPLPPMGIHATANFFEVASLHRRGAQVTANRSAAANPLLFVDPQGHAYRLRQAAGGYDTYAIPSADGHRLAFLEYTTRNNAWMNENFCQNLLEEWRYTPRGTSLSIRSDNLST
jgi:hypothetical protein